MRMIFLPIMAFLHLFARAQYTLHINLLEIPEHTTGDVYIAGNFNNWNPADKRYRLSQTDGHYSISIPSLKKGEYEFKFTQGSWQKVEVKSNQVGIENRKIKLSSDTVLDLTIEAWNQEHSNIEKKHTASSNVHILDTSFKIPQLKRTRRIWIYLPANYEKGKKHYPVLYMHDGQNLFDDYTSYSGEWGVDETLDSMNAQCIVVGIDNGQDKRMNEYNIHNSEKYGKGEGRQYLQFIVKTLKPYIDKRYRTLPAKQSTFMAGSSMGGLISFYAGLLYPETFGGLGIFSPAFWLAPEVRKETKKFMKVQGHATQKYFFYAGGEESETMVRDMLYIFDMMHQHKKTGMKAVIRTEGQHNEARWKLEFPAFYKWMIGS